MPQLVKILRHSQVHRDQANSFRCRHEASRDFSSSIVIRDPISRSRSRPFRAILGHHKKNSRPHRCQCRQGRVEIRLLMPEDRYPMQEVQPRRTHGQSHMSWRCRLVRLIILQTVRTQHSFQIMPANVNRTCGFLSLDRRSSGRQLHRHRDSAWLLRQEPNNTE